MLPSHDPSPDRLTDLMGVMRALRAASPVFSAGTAIVFLKMIEFGGGAYLAEIASGTGLPFTQVCRFAGNLSDGLTRNVSALGLIAPEARDDHRPPRYSLTSEGWDLASRIGVAVPAASERAKAA